MLSSWVIEVSVFVVEFGLTAVSPTYSTGLVLLSS